MDRLVSQAQFNTLLSEVIMYVQCIENDLKLICAGAYEGDFEKNYDYLEKSNLGQTIIILKKIDMLDGHQDISNEDYKVLNKIREMRNYWCHQCYIDYVYTQNEVLKMEKFQKIAKKLIADHDKLQTLHKDIEECRLEVLKWCKRI